MKIEKISINNIKPYENNPRKNDDAVRYVTNSIKEFGFRNPIIIDKDNVVICGHTRLKAAKKLKFKTVPCVSIDDLTAEQIKAFRLADNKVTEFSNWDFSLLNDEFEILKNFDLSKFGFDLDIFEDKEEVIEDEFDEELPKEPKSKYGEIYQLGNHRLMCGDSTKEEDIEKLMDNKKAELTVTSPPYGVGKGYEEYGIAPWFKTIRPVIENICKVSEIVCWNLGDLYATGSQFIEPTNVYSVNMFMENEFKPLWLRIWKKNGLNYSIAPYHLNTNKPVQQYEYIWAFANKDHKFKKRLTDEENRDWGWHGIWEINTVKENKKHPAMFPVELPVRCIKMHSDKDDIILDPFGGSGTTLIACEQLNRRCFMVEIDPKYVDLIINRWETFTGKKAIKIE